MTELRQAIHGYVRRPYHEKVALWWKMGWPDQKSLTTIQERDITFFRWVVDEKKIDELITLLK